MHTHVEYRFYKRVEHCLLALFIICRSSLLLLQWNVPEGFDWRAHVEMIHAITWAKPTTGLFDLFYGYHPPLSFLLARIPFSFGIPDVASVQIIDTLASLVAFFFLRATLKRLGLLTSIGPMMFLYVTSSLPIQIFLSHGVNMDVLILACASALLYCSVRLFHLSAGRKIIHAHHECFWMLCMTGIVIAAFMTKFTAILLPALPIIVAVAFSHPRRWLRTFSLGIVSVSAGLMLVFPYYYQRYYTAEGTFFPSNTDVYDADGQAGAREARDENLPHFLASILSPTTPAHDPGPQFRDLDTPRLADTWKDIWMQDHWMGDQPENHVTIGEWYEFGASMLMLFGAFAYVFRLRKGGMFERFGAAVTMFGLLHVLFMICYLYRNPWGGGVPSKAIYIAPVVWMIGYFICYGVHVLDGSRWRIVSIGTRILALSGTIAFMLVNHLLPLY